MTYLPKTVKVLREHGYLRAKGRPDRAKLADDCHRLVFEQVVEAGEEEIVAKGLWVADFVHKLFGEVEDVVAAELRAIVGPLAGPEGLVQEKMENGYLLCSAPVTRTLSDNGDSPTPVTRQAKFVTMNHDLIERYYELPAVERIVQAARTSQRRHALAVRRQPELEARRRPMVERAYERLELEMPRAS